MTPNREDYLKAFYKLGKNGQLITNKQLADELRISPASVTEMLSKLSKEGMIEYQAYKGSKLTALGLQKTIAFVRGHRLWEVFLIRHLGYSWSEAHEDAELLEHVTTERLTTRLDKFLNYPAYCPHGSMIPSLDGTPEALFTRELSMLEIGEASVIRRVNEEKELLDYLQALGLEIDAAFTVTAKEPYEGSITITLADKAITLSYKAACQIFVG